jgi:hypothetical protein
VRIVQVRLGVPFGWCLKTSVQTGLPTIGEMLARLNGYRRCCTVAYGEECEMEKMEASMK